MKQNEVKAHYGSWILVRVGPDFIEITLLRFGMGRTKWHFFTLLADGQDFI